MKITPEMVLIGKMYRALTKESWEEGPTESEAIGAAQDWYWNNFDGTNISTTEGLERLRLARRPRKTDKNKRGVK